MSIMDSDGHPHAGLFEHTLFFVRGNARLQVNATNIEGREMLERIGAVQVSQDDYERADALGKDGGQ